MRRLLLLGLCAAPLAAHADAADLMAIANPAVLDARPTLRVAATGFAADDSVPAHRIADTWRHVRALLQKAGVDKQDVEIVAMLHALPADQELP